MDSKGFLFFEDITYDFEHPRDDWTTVSRLDNFGTDDVRFLFSVLIPNTKEAKNTLLSKTDWRLDVTSCNSYFFHNEKDEIEFEQDTIHREDIPISPFTIYFESYGPYSEKVELIQNFILYHNLRLNSDGNYVEPHDGRVVVRIKPRHHIQVNTNLLRDYLAARNKILLRCHTYDRKVSQKYSEFIDEERKVMELKHENYVLSLLIVKDQLSKDTTASYLHGLDIIYPFKEPQHKDFLYLAGKDERKYADFIIGVDDSGNVIEKKCNEDEGLTLCFFDKKILKKFYDEPEKYSVEDGGIHRIGIWDIEYDMNSEGIVHVWLYKLKFLPYEDQLYWKSFNIKPSSGMSRTFFQRCLEAKFAESKNPIEIIKHGYKDTNKKFQQKFGFKLFLDLKISDQYVLKTTHVLLTEEQSEFDQQISNLAKLFVEYLNKADLEKNTKWKHTSESENKSLYYLEHFLEEKLQLDSTTLKETMQGFRVVQSIRSKSSAHAKSSGYEDDIKKILELDTYSVTKSYFKLIKLLFYSLKHIRSSID